MKVYEILRPGSPMVTVFAEGYDAAAALFEEWLLHRPALPKGDYSVRKASILRYTYDAHLTGAVMLGIAGVGYWDAKLRTLMVLPPDVVVEKDPLNDAAEVQAFYVGGRDRNHLTHRILARTYEEAFSIYYDAVRSISHGQLLDVFFMVEKVRERNFAADFLRKCISDGQTGLFIVDINGNPTLLQSNPRTVITPFDKVPGE